MTPSFDGMELMPNYRKEMMMNKESINIEMVTNPYGDQAFRATVEILFSTDVHFTDSAHEFISRALDNRWQVDDWAIVDTRGEK